VPPGDAVARIRVSGQFGSAARAGVGAAYQASAAATTAAAADRRAFMIASDLLLGCRRP